MHPYDIKGLKNVVSFLSALIERAEKTPERTMPRRGEYWTPEEQKALIELIAEKFSASMIAHKLTERFGRQFTKRAIVGRAYRHGLSIQGGAFVTKSKRKQKAQSVAAAQKPAARRTTEPRLRRANKDVAKLKAKINAARAAGMPVAKIAKKHGVSPSYVYMIGTGAR